MSQRFSEGPCIPDKLKVESLKMLAFLAIEKDWKSYVQYMH